MKIAICTPIARAPHPEHVRSIQRVGMELGGAEIIRLDVVGQANTPRARNVLAFKALEAGADSIVFVDDDISFEPSEFAKMYEHEAGVVAGAPPRREHDPAKFNGMRFCARIDETPMRKGRLLSGQAATAFLRIDRVVLEYLRDEVLFKRFEKVLVPVSTGTEIVNHEHEICTGRFSYAGIGTDIPAWFHYRVAPTPAGAHQVAYQGEDFAFSDLCRMYGIDVWIDPEIRLNHWHTLPLDACMADCLQEEANAA